MDFRRSAFALAFALLLGRGEGLFSRFSGGGRTNQGRESVDVCETVRVMPRIAMAVVGGAPLKVENSAPYVAAVGEAGANGSVSWFCGGSLISPRHVLTAAHCLISRNVSAVRLGSFSARTSSTKNDHEVAEAVIHPGYRITESYDDIGILRMRDEVEFDGNVKPVCLPERNDETYERERAKVIGWGAEEFGGEGTQKLRQVEVEVFSNSDCQRAYSNSTIAPKTFPRGIKSEQLCAGSKKGGKDACQGDSGGPLVLTDERGIVRQIGIVSTGAGCGFKMYPGVYTRVSSYADWIREEVKASGSARSSPKDSPGRGSSTGENTREFQGDGGRKSDGRTRTQGSSFGDSGETHSGKGGISEADSGKPARDSRGFSRGDGHPEEGGTGRNPNDFQSERPRHRRSAGDVRIDSTTGKTSFDRNP